MMHPIELNYPPVGAESVAICVPDELIVTDRKQHKTIHVPAGEIVKLSQTRAFAQIEYNGEIFFAWGILKHDS